MFLGNSYLIKYTQNSIEELIKLGNYDEVDSNINDNNFWIDPNISNHIYLPYDLRSLSTNGVFKEFEKLELRVATMTELLLFGAQYPDVQKDFPIIAFGANWTKGRSSKFVAGLTTSDNGKRKLGLHLMDSIWSYNYRFAAVEHSL